MSLDRWLADRARERERAGLTRCLGDRAEDQGLLDLAGNDYLGLSRHPRVAEAAAQAALTWGAGAGASRLVTGTLGVHRQLESVFARFCGQPAGLVFSTGYHANLAVVAALADEDTLIVSDAHVHASLIDACRLARVRVQVTPHNDVGAVRAALVGRAEHRALVLVESIYSVFGDAAPLAELASLCAEHDGVLIVDEAHAIGIAGNRGQGLVSSLGLAGQSGVIVTATLSKSLGSQGGAVLGSTALVEHLVNKARPFIYDTGLAPAAAGGALAALRVLQDEPERATAARACTSALADAVRTVRPAGAVLAVPTPGPREALAAQAHCAKRGLRVGCFRPPSTPDGSSRLRITGRATLQGAELDQACRTLSESLADAFGGAE
jgi:8-amino-7-oxononanoate synthase